LTAPEPLAAKTQLDRSSREASPHALAVEVLLQELNASSAGLSSAEACRRLEKFGPNRLPPPYRPGRITIYLRQFTSPLVYLLLAAAALSLLLGHVGDAVFIFAVLQVNALIGAIQEGRAESSAAALHRLVPLRAVVVRDGAPREIDATEVVPGDIVRLTAGAKVPADLRLLSAVDLAADESALTGESVPVSKEPAVLDPDCPAAERRNMLYAGTVVVRGRAEAVAVLTGTATEIGRIAGQLGGAGAALPLLVKLNRLGRLIAVVMALAILGLGGVMLAQGGDLIDIAVLAIALGVSAIPEGLPIAISVALAVAAHRMARRNVVVRALAAVEGLGACTVIASDKTGTLTQNRLTVERTVLPGGKSLIIGPDLPDELNAPVQRLARAAVLCSELHRERTSEGARWVGDSVDVAILTMAERLGIDPEAVENAAPLEASIPYEPQRRAAVAWRASPRLFAYVKGAAETVLPYCAGPVEDALRDADRLAAEGYRVIAVARGPGAIGQTPRNLTLLGLIGIIDPLRPEAAEAVRRCRSAGISVRMVTGDHPATALAIARRLAIAESPDQVISGAALSVAAERPAEFQRALAAKVFARIDPSQKRLIVEGLERSGEVVAVTGDGVNDAPALHAASIGVAMGRGGTDLARSAADLILVDDNFASIIAGVEEGRIAYANIRKVLQLLLSTGMAEIVIFVLSLAAGLPMPLTAVQLLWLNLVTNGVQDVGLAVEGGEPDTLTRPPRSPREPILDRRLMSMIIAAGLFMGSVSFVVFYQAIALGWGTAEAQNLTLLLLVLFENVHALNCRSERASLFSLPLKANPFLIWAVIGAQALHIAAMHIPVLNGVLNIQPVAVETWIAVAVLAATLAVLMEGWKWVQRRLERPALIDTRAGL
jgi:P-type Ca2+ transporter type 2C